MSASFYELLKFAKTGIASPEMTHYDKLKALAMCKAGFPVKTLTDVPPITFQSDGTPLTAWSISGNMTQTGTPTPSAPITPQECGDKTENQYDKSTTVIYNAYLNESNIWIASDDSRSIIIPVNGGTQYTLSVPEALSVFLICEASQEPVIGGTYSRIVRASSAIDSYTFTTQSDTKYIIFQGGKASFDIWFNGLMLNTGSTALPFEPFGYKLPLTLAGQTQTVYLSEPLRKIGDYADKIEAIGTTATVTRKIRKCVVTSDKIGSFNSGLHRIGIGVLASVSPDAAICSHYKVQVKSDGSFAHMYIGSNNQYIFIFDPSFETQTDAVNFLDAQNAAGTPVCVWYVLATAQTETVTVPTLTPQKGSNTLTVGTTLQPSEVSITGKIKSS